MSIFNLFKPKLNKAVLNGVLPDIRPPEEKAKDYRFEELFTAAPLNWVDFDTWKQDPKNQKMLNDIQVNNQNQSKSCASQASSLALAINNYIETGVFRKFSAKPIYARRRNNPDYGMYMDDVGNICITYGTVYDILYPSPNIENQINDLNGYTDDFEAIGKILKAKSYIWVSGSIDNYAQVASMGKPVVITVTFGEHEWGNEMVPQIRDTVTKYGHAITILPNGNFTYQGKKAVLIQDSWGTGVGWNGRRILTEDWFSQQRVLFGIWFEDLNNLAVFNSSPDLPKIHYQWTRDLSVGMRGDDVAMLQVALGIIKDNNGYLFPLLNGQSPTGYYGGLTRAAVKRFQAMYGMPVDGVCNMAVRVKLNNMFS